MADELIHTSPATAPESREMAALDDLRSRAMSVPVEVMQKALAEYAERRVHFRQWLMDQLVEGVHYGFPPGCVPKLDDDGNIKQWNNKKSSYDIVPKSQWKAKQSLYKAGADFICDLMGAIDSYHPDLDAWKQLGEPSGTFVFVCQLHSRATGALIGEGRGVRKVGQKGGDENNALKMAKKSAKVDAVLNAYGLSDLFTQDTEDDAPPHDNPTVKPDAARAAPRGKRVTKEEGNQIYREFKTAGGNDADWQRWVHEVTGRTFDVGQIVEWTASDVMALQQAIKSGYVGAQA